MAEGFRISESGDLRVTEASVSRTTEGFEVGESALSASGSVASVSYLSTTGSASLSGQGSKLSAGYSTLEPTVSLSAVGSLSDTAQVVLLAEAPMVATGTMAPVDSLRTAFGEAPLSATGSKAAAGLKTLFGNITAGTDEVTRITEAGDIRVLENGTDTRTAIAAYGNIIFATIVGNPSKTFFSSQPYYKDAGSWKTFIPNVKWNGAWTQNLKIYKHTNGAWKRSY
jgi:hypothetical protein